MRVAVIGANGQLGSELMALGNATEGFCMIGFTHDQCEVSTRDGVASLRAAQPDVMVNTAAMHDLAACESDPRMAARVNRAVPVMEVAEEVGARYIYVSTDYVFDGEEGNYAEAAQTRPLSVYGRTKRLGEALCGVMVEPGAVCRVSHLFGKTGCRAKRGGNFVQFVLAALRDGRPVALDDDTRFSPTYARDAAQAILGIAEAGGEGIYHVANDSACSHYEFGVAVADLCALPYHNLSPRYNEPSPLRPQRSNLVNTRLPASPHWRDGLQRYLQEMNCIE